MNAPVEARETSGATTGLVLGFVRQQAGEAAVEETLRRAGIVASPEDLSRPSQWIGYDTRIRLFAAATEVLGDPETMFRSGSRSTRATGTPGWTATTCRASSVPCPRSSACRRRRSCTRPASPTAIPRASTT